MKKSLLLSTIKPSILVFELVDTFVIYFLGTISLSDRLLLHLPMVPFVAGVGYEGIKLSAESDSIFFRILKQPGL